MPIPKEILVKLSLITDGFTKPMIETNKQFDKHFTKTGEFNKSYTKNQTLMTKLGARMRYITRGIRGFRMGLLGVAFTMQMVSKSLQGLLSPALEATGVFPTLGAALTLFFLPFGLWSEDTAISILEFLEKAPPQVKEFANIFVPLLTAVSAIMAIVAFFGITMGMFKGFLALALLVAAATFVIMNYKNAWQGLVNIWIIVYEWVKWLRWRLINFFQSIWDWVEEKFPSMSNPFKKLGDWFEWLLGKAKDIWGKITDLVPDWIKEKLGFGGGKFTSAEGFEAIDYYYRTGKTPVIDKEREATLTLKVNLPNGTTTHVNLGSGKGDVVADLSVV